MWGRRSLDYYISGNSDRPAAGVKLINRRETVCFLFAGSIVLRIYIVMQRERSFNVNFSVDFVHKSACSEDEQKINLTGHHYDDCLTTYHLTSKQQYN